MKITELVFVCIKGLVFALNRYTGEQMWETHLKGSDFVNVVLQDERLFASCAGEIFCLNPVTGVGLWRNPLKGFGTGLATIATEHNPSEGNAVVLAEKRRRDE